MSVLLEAKIEAVDHRATVERISSRNREFLSGIATLNTLVNSRDGMLSDNDEYYFMTGRSAIDLIETAIRFSRFRNRRQVKSVLDFACGYGRVLRWLRSYFDHADVLGVDVDGNAVASVAQLLGVQAQVIDPTWSDLPDRRFDLIWMGSLLTHLSENRCKDLLLLLRSRLAEGGLLVATMHGPYVANRLATRDKTYNLTEAGVTEIVRQYEETGFGFQAYPGSTDYGISINTLGRLEQICAASSMNLRLYVERGWMSHQDVFACVKA